LKIKGNIYSPYEGKNWIIEAEEGKKSVLPTEWSRLPVCAGLFGYRACPGNVMTIIFSHAVRLKLHFLRV